MNCNHHIDDTNHTDNVSRSGSGSKPTTQQHGAAGEKNAWPLPKLINIIES